MIASHTEASTRSDSTSISALRPVLPSGAAALELARARPAARATRAQDAPAHRLGAHLGQPPGAVALEARIEVGGDGEAQDHVPQEGQALVGLGAVLDPGRVREGLPPKLLRQLRQELRKADSGLDLRGMGGDEVRGLTDREDLGRLLVGDADPVAVLELDHQLDQVERVGLEVLLEAGVLADARRVDLELGGQVLANACEDLLSGHRLRRR